MDGMNSFAGQVRARSFVARLSIELVASRSARRVGDLGREGAGDRPAPSLADTALRLVSGEERGVFVGVRKARAVSPVVAQYDKYDGRRLGVMAYCAALERVGAARCADYSGDRISASSGSRPDGGASARLEDATLLRTVREAVDPARPGMAEVLVLQVQRRRRNETRQDITARALFDAVAIEGLSVAEILRRNGWSVQAANSALLMRAAEGALWRVADALGFRGRIVDEDAA